MLDLIEKLINEHGTSAILHERLGLIKAQYEVLERENVNLKTQCQTQQTEIQQIRMRLAETEAALQALNRGTFAKYVCDHCGSPDLVRTGNKPSSAFGVLGIKTQVFRCNACGRECEHLP
jgi:hypothetical protein